MKASEYRMRLKTKHNFFIFISFITTACSDLGGQGFKPLNSTGCTQDSTDPICTEDKAYRIEIQRKHLDARVPAGSIAIDLGGDCFAPGYTLAVIAWKLKHVASQTIVAQSGGLTSTCDSMGRFRVRVEIPSGTNLAERHAVTLTLFAIDPDSHQQIGNPYGLNEKTIDLIPE